MFHDMWDEAEKLFDKVVDANEFSFVAERLSTRFFIHYCIGYVKTMLHEGLIIFLSFYLALRIAFAENLPLIIQILSIYAITVTLPLIVRIIFSTRAERFCKKIPDWFYKNRSLWKK